MVRKELTRSDWSDVRVASPAWRCWLAPRYRPVEQLPEEWHPRRLRYEAVRPCAPGWKDAWWARYAAVRNAFTSPTTVHEFTMLKDRFISLIGRENYVRFVMRPNYLYHAFRPFRHPAARIIRRLCIPRGGVVLDIGANIGRFTALAAGAVGRQGRVYSFEPVPMAVQVLRTMVRLRRLAQVIVVEAALGSETATATMSIPLKHGWMPLLPTAHLAGPDERSTANVDVAILQLDEFCESQGVGRVDFIKCDVEGGEHGVFTGGMRCLTRDRPSVMCEVESGYSSRYGVRPSAVFDIFTSLDYLCFHIREDRTLTPVNGYVSEADYLFVHPSRMNAGALQPYIRPASAAPV